MSKSFSHKRNLLDVLGTDYERKLAKRYIKQEMKHRKTVRKNKRMVAEIGDTNSNVVGE